MIQAATTNYNTKLFCEIWSEYSGFESDYQNVGIPTKISLNSLRTLYYLLYARFGNTPIANYDENQFKYKVFGIIFSSGPAWEKRVEIQDRLRELTEDEILAGSKAIYNHAQNPASEPTDHSTEELNYINDQNVTKFKKAKLDAYGQLWELLSTDVTSSFINQFAVCFKKFAQPERPVLYESED